MTNKLKKALKQQKKQTTQAPLPITGTLGIPIGGQKRVEVPSRKSFVYVKLRDNQNEVIQAFNNTVSSSYGLPVIVERRDGRYVVVSVDTIRYQNNWTSFAPYLARHGNVHSFNLESGGGGDIVWVYSRQFMPALILPSGSSGGPNVMMSDYTLRNNDGSWKYIGNTGTPNITPYKPTNNQAVMVLVYLDTASGNPYLMVGSGSYFAATLTGTNQIVSYIPTDPNPNHIPLSAIRLVSGTTNISWDNIYDVRQFLHPIITGSGGGTVVTGSASSPLIVDNLTSQINGTGTHFTLIGTADPGTLRLYFNGLRQVLTDNYTLDGNYQGLTTLFTPIIGDSLVADYGDATTVLTGVAYPGFSTILVSGQSNVVADGPASNVIFQAGTGMAIETNAGLDTVTFHNIMSLAPNPTQLLPCVTDFIEENLISNTGYYELGGYYGWIASNGTIGSSLGDINHPGWVGLNCGTNANSGISLASQNNAIMVNGGEISEYVFYVSQSTNLIGRLGLSDSINQVAPVGGVWIDIAATTLSGKCANTAGSTSTTPTTYTISTGTWYRGKIIINDDATTATFYLYDCATGALLWTAIVTSNLPPNNYRLPATKVTALKTSVSGAGAEIMRVDWMSMYCTKAMVR